MIVKIERHLGEQNWLLIDNIAKVSCSKQMLYKTKEIINDDDVVLLDHREEYDCKCVGKCVCKIKCIWYYRLICRTKDNDEFSIVFDTVAYLCNDEGKTIEKIVANCNE